MVVVVVVVVVGLSVTLILKEGGYVRVGVRRGIGEGE